MGVLSYLPRSRLRRWLPIKLAAICTVLVAIGWVLVFRPIAAGEVRIRRHCGAIQTRTRYLDLELFSFESISQTPFSLAVRSSPSLAGHSHDWLYAQGGGSYLFGGNSCGLGRGYEVFQTIHNRYGSAVLLSELIATGQLALADAWRVRLLNPATNSTAEMELVLLEVPEGGFDSHADFRTWQDSHDVSAAIARIPPP